MPVWPIEPIEHRPDVTLVSWSVYEVPLDGEDQPWTRHFVGYAVEDRQGQVSSPVRAFDPARRSGETRSGRVYHLRGSPGGNSDAEYVWNLWKSLNNITTARDVTAEVKRELAAAQTSENFQRGNQGI